jgi:hypothetical protein
VHTALMALAAGAAGERPCRGGSLGRFADLTAEVTLRSMHQCSSWSLEMYHAVAHLHCVQCTSESDQFMYTHTYVWGVVHYGVRSRLSRGLSERIAAANSAR